MHRNPLDRRRLSVSAVTRGRETGNTTLRAARPRSGNRRVDSREDSGIRNRKSYLDRQSERPKEGRRRSYQWYQMGRGWIEVSDRGIFGPIGGIIIMCERKSPGGVWRQSEGKGKRAVKRLIVVQVEHEAVAARVFCVFL